MPTITFTGNSEILAFVEYFAVSLNKSKRTAKEYARDLARFERFIAPSETALVDATTQQIESWRDHLLAEGRNQPQSVCRKLAAVAAFFKWRKRKKILGRENPYDGVDKPKVGKRLPKTMSAGDIEKILNARIPHRRWKKFLETRDDAMFEIMYGSGLRRAEVCGLDVTDIDVAERQVRVRHGKGDKERYSFLSGPAIEKVRTYLEQRAAKAHPGESALFVTVCGGRISPRQLWAEFDRARTIADLPNVVPHTFRHAFATDCYRNGMDIRTLQTLLGHESIATTQIYTRVTLEHARAAYEASHPRARIASAGSEAQS